MKKLLFIAMMGMMSLGVFASSLNYRLCTVHYTRVIIYPDNDQRTISFSHTAGTCAEAVSNARAAADIIEEAL